MFVSIKVFSLFPSQEHDNEAETLVSSLMVAYDDDDLDIGVYFIPDFSSTNLS